MSKSNVIAFKGFDPDDTIIMKGIGKLIKLVTDSDVFLYMLRDIMIKHALWKQDLITDIKKKLQVAKKFNMKNKSEEEMQEFEEFSKCVIRMYGKVNTPDFLNQLYHAKLIEQRDKQKALDVVRGKVFEHICIAFLEKRKEIDRFAGCDIYIDGERIITSFEDGHPDKHSVDYALKYKFIDENEESTENYEIYEFKIRPEGFSKYNYIHFANIKEKMELCEVTVKMIAAAFEDTISLQSRIYEIEELIIGNKISIILIGIDRLRILEVAVAS